MGTKSSKEAHGAAGKGNLLLFDPDKIHLIARELSSERRST